MKIFLIWLKDILNRVLLIGTLDISQFKIIFDVTLGLLFYKKSRLRFSIVLRGSFAAHRAKTDHFSPKKVKSSFPP